MKKYRIIKKPYGYIVLNKLNGNHAHLPNKKGCMILLKLLKSGADIKDPYLRECKERLEKR